MWESSTISLKMVVKTSDKNQFSFFHVLNSFLKLTRPDHDALMTAYILNTIVYIRTWNFNTTRIQVYQLCFKNLQLISFIVWKLCVFWHRWNFVNSQQFFYHNFWLKEKFKILMVSSERSGSDISKYTRFHI